MKVLLENLIWKSYLKVLFRSLFCKSYLEVLFGSLVLIPYKYLISHMLKKYIPLLLFQTYSFIYKFGMAFYLQIYNVLDMLVNYSEIDYQHKIWKLLHESIGKLLDRSVPVIPRTRNPYHITEWSIHRNTKVKLNISILAWCQRDIFYYIRKNDTQLALTNKPLPGPTYGITWILI